MTPKWDAIKTEYITTKISYRKLAAKWDVSFRTLADRAKREGWPGERERYQGDVVTQTVQKLADSVSSDKANKLFELQLSADRMGQVISAVFDDVAQFNRHIVGKDEQVYKKVDTRAIKDLASAMKDLTYVLRNIYDLPTLSERSAMDIAAQRLQLDRAKANADKEDENEISIEFYTPEEKGWSE